MTNRQERQFQEINISGFAGPAPSPISHEEISISGDAGPAPDGNNQNHDVVMISVDSRLFQMVGKKLRPCLIQVSLNRTKYWAGHQHFKFDGQKLSAGLENERARSIDCPSATHNSPKDVINSVVIYKGIGKAEYKVRGIRGLGLTFCRVTVMGTESTIVRYAGLEILDLDKLGWVIPWLTYEPLIRLVEQKAAQALLYDCKFREHQHLLKESPTQLYIEKIISCSFQEGFEIAEGVPNTKDLKLPSTIRHQKEHSRAKAMLFNQRQRLLEKAESEAVPVPVSNPAQDRLVELLPIEGGGESGGQGGAQPGNKPVLEPLPTVLEWRPTGDGSEISAPASANGEAKETEVKSTNGAAEVIDVEEAAAEVVTNAEAGGQGEEAPKVSPIVKRLLEMVAESKE